MRWARLLPVAGCTIILCGSLSGIAFASTSAPEGNFNILVTPSPLVASVEPGTQKQLELKIYDQSPTAEGLKIGTRSFTFNSKTGQVDLNTTPALINSWVHFSAPTFTVQSGQWFDEFITISLPKDAGFSYSFALVISPQEESEDGNGRAIDASLAVFTLLNVDRPGATSNLSLVDFTTTQGVYEYLPATLNIRLRNNGNTIIQPSGNVFIERSVNAKHPIATLPANPRDEYILPGTERTLTTQWDDGFASYQTAQTPSGSLAQHFTLDWSKLSRFRIGRYTAQVVAVYDNNGYDMPLEGTITFWVIPWRAILVLIAIIVALWLLIHGHNKRRTEKAVRWALAKAEADRKTKQS